MGSAGRCSRGGGEEGRRRQLSPRHAVCCVLVMVLRNASLYFPGLLWSSPLQAPVRPWCAGRLVVLHLWGHVQYHPGGAHGGLRPPQPPEHHVHAGQRPGAWRGWGGKQCGWEGAEATDQACSGSPCRLVPACLLSSWMMRVPHRLCRLSMCLLVSSLLVDHYVQSSSLC